MAGTHAGADRERVVNRLRTVVIATLLAGFAAAAAARAEDQARRSAGRPLKVFILAGQSNMQGHAHVRTLEHLAMNPETRPMLAAIQNADGTPKVHPHVWISSLSDAGVRQGQLTTGYGASAEKIGPELMFGITLHEALDEPILLIKTAWGGRSLHTDFRPPSAGPFTFRDDQLEKFRKEGKDVATIEAEKAAATGKSYRDMIEYVRTVLADLGRACPEHDAKAGYELAGFAWLQGWNDMVDGGVYPNRDRPGGYDQYSENLAHLIRDVRRDLDAPTMPFVIGVMGVGGPTADYRPEQQRYARVHQNFRDAMAAPAKLPEFRDTVVAILAEKYWDPELTSLQSRASAADRQAEQLAKERHLDAAATRALKAQLRSEEFTPRESETLAKGISNFEFHYLGSARILGGIGQGMAEAMAKLVGRN